MTWLQKYRLRRYLMNSIWIVPALSMAAALLAVQILHSIDQKMGWQAGVDPDTARALLGTMASSMFTFIVFVCSALLVSLQLASAQLTPRIMAIVFHDPRTRTSLAVFVFTFTFSLATQVRVTSAVPALTTYVAVYGSLASLGFFLYLIEHVGKALRPSGALRTIAAQARAVIQNVYPTRLADQPGAPTRPAIALERGAIHTVRARKFGVVLAFDLPGLVALAQRSDCVIEMVPEVGDFVATGDPLFLIFSDGAGPRAEALHQSIAVGQERTLEQDPAFAFRIMVDIASKALSPAINDPTTAVLALDQIQHLLREVGTRCLDSGRARDRADHVRLIYRTPDWEDFVQLAVTEIRQFGETSIQVVRRLRAMMENLIETLPEQRAVLLRQELKLLDRSAKRAFKEPADVAMAEFSDLQGVGGNRP